MGADPSPFFLTRTVKGFYPKRLSIKVDCMSNEFMVKTCACYLKGSMLGARVHPTDSKATCWSGPEWLLK